MRQMRTPNPRWAVLAILLSALGAPMALARPLEIYFVDVEGGQSTLIVSPSGQTLLIDTGWRGFEGRDADRIVQAAKAAKVTANTLLTEPSSKSVSAVTGRPSIRDAIPVA